jgi:eukaryotic-like serine/threonine-protein kinase
MDATEELPRGADRLALGRYRLGPRLGSGGFGTVFSARDERLNRPVAVKVMPAGGPSPERAQREALAAARLHHPGIVAVFDAGQDRAGRYLVSELVRGRTLAELDAAGELSDRDVLRAGLALADALAHAHERGVIHRDVKPQNVIVPDEETDWRAAAKLTDFGIAHVVDDAPLTQTGDVVGTLAYMAPEQAAGERVDERADLYSLALVLYEGLAGTNPVRGANPAATARLVGTELPSLARHRADLPDELCAALDRALLPEPEERGTLGELARELAAALPEVDDEGGTIAPHPLEGPRPAVPLLARAAAGVAAGGLGVAALVAADDPRYSPFLAAIAIPLVALFPRAGWLVTAAACVAVLAGPLPDAATLVAAAAAAPPLLLQRSGIAWSLPGAAPVLGLGGLAGAYPALSGRVGGMWTRAALGAIGMWWLLLAEPLLDRDLWLGAQPAAGAIEHIATSGALLFVPVWALASLVLPWLVAGRALALDVVGATVWAAATVSGVATLAEYAGLPEPRGLVVGGIVAGLLAVIGARDTVIPGI